jgi:hypothetical protein
MINAFCFVNAVDKRKKYDEKNSDPNTFIPLLKTAFCPRRHKRVGMYELMGWTHLAGRQQGIPVVTDLLVTFCSSIVQTQYVITRLNLLGS